MRPLCKLTDDQLLALLKTGDYDAYRVLYTKYWEQLYNSVYKRLKVYDQAKDITQDIFLQLWIKRESQTINNLQSYLLTAGKYSVFKCMELQERFVPVEDLFFKLKTSSEQADSKLLMKEFLTAWEKMVCNLPQGQQTVFRMRYQQDVSPADIAKELNISDKTVRNQLGKALIRLKAAIFSFILLSLLNL